MFDAFPEKFLTTYLIDDVAPEFITEFETEGTRLLSPICRWILTSNYNQEELLIMTVQIKKPSFADFNGYKLCQMKQMTKILKS